MSTLPILGHVNAIAEVSEAAGISTSAYEQRKVDEAIEIMLAKERMSKPFRFVDLPAEIRNLVYSLLLAGDKEKPLDLASFRSPAITRVSKQLRSEALAVLFAEGYFFVVVGATFRTRGLKRIGHFSSELAQKRAKKAGKFHVSRGVLRFLRETKAVLRGITIQVIEADFYGCKGLQESWYGASLKLGYEAGSSYITSAVRPDDLFLLLFTGDYEEEDVVFHLNAAKSEAEQIIASKKDFKGFTLSDLRKIARLFRQA